MTSSSALPFCGQSVPLVHVDKWAPWLRSVGIPCPLGITVPHQGLYIVRMEGVREDCSPMTTYPRWLITTSTPAPPFTLKPTPFSKPAWLVAKMQLCTSHANPASNVGTSSRTLVSAGLYTPEVNRSR